MRKGRDTKGRYTRKMPRLRNALAGLCAVVWAVNGIDIYTEIHSEKIVWTIENPFFVEAAKAKTNSKEEELPDPCGLSDVVCQDNSDETPTEPSGSIQEMIRSAFPEEGERAVRIFKCESGLDPKRHSAVDITRDGHPFSIGLAQINLTVTSVDGLDCKNAFVGTNKSAVVVDESLYRQCVLRAENPSVSLAIAREKYDNRGGTFGAWAICSKGN